MNKICFCLYFRYLCYTEMRAGYAWYSSGEVSRFLAVYIRFPYIKNNVKTPIS